MDSEPGFDVQALDAWIGDRLPGFGIPLRATRMGHGTGQANELYWLRRGEHVWVLRRPPKVINAPGASDMTREWRILSALERETFGQPLADRQGVQWMLADCARDLYIARLMAHVRHHRARDRRRPFLKDVHNGGGNSPAPGLSSPDVPDARGRMSRQASAAFVHDQQPPAPRISPADQPPS